MRHWYSEDKPTPHWESTADSLFLYDGSNRVLLRESLGTILERQLSAIGYQPTDSIPEDTLQLYLPQLLTYRSPGGKVCFEREPRLGDAHRRYPRKILLREIAF